MNKKISVLSLVIIMILSLAGCNSGKTNGDYFGKIEGEYQVVEQDNPDDYVGSWWHLSISAGDEENTKYLAIYDNEAGNPGVEGKITYIDDSKITVEIDPEYYDELPSSQWESDGKTLDLNYEKTATGIKLTNNNKTLMFEFDEE